MTYPVLGSHDPAPRERDGFHAQPSRGKSSPAQVTLTNEPLLRNLCYQHHGVTMSQAPELKATLSLPQTAFPMKANLPHNEPLRLARWASLRLYEELRKAGAGRPTYILHDGPPYANGPIHLGHALNKG